MSGKYKISETGPKPSNLGFLDPSLPRAFMDQNPQVRKFHIFLGMHMYLWQIYRTDRESNPSDYQYRISTRERDDMVRLIQKWASENLKNTEPWGAMFTFFGECQLHMGHHGAVGIYIPRR